MKEYNYYGPVVRVDIFNNECEIDSVYKGSTYAESEKKARNNLIYRYKRLHGIPISVRLKLPGKLTESD